MKNCIYCTNLFILNLYKCNGCVIQPAGEPSIAWVQKYWKGIPTGNFIRTNFKHSSSKNISNGLSTPGGSVAVHVLHQPLELFRAGVGWFSLVHCA